MPETLSLVEVTEPAIAARARSTRPSASARHISHKRRDQAVDLAVMLDAFADREDRRGRR